MLRPTRRALLLLTVFWPAAALAQAPDARPQGGQVVAGQARITQGAATTRIDQSSGRAVIEWQGFDVGRNHQVEIAQPNAAAWSLQRVTGGAPSAIAGRITSNGGVAIVNPAGVTFAQGAQVDVGSLIAGTSDITTGNFMAGRMVFDGAPRPGARVENHGTVTLRDQGVAALVGPHVANHGTIRARLGRVALAGGAEAFALDLAGDGLLSLDVTRQVQGSAVQGAAGRIDAAGGHVLITAGAVSDTLEALVSADVALAGQVAARQVVANATGAVTVQSGAEIAAHGEAARVVVGAGEGSRIGTPQRLATRSTVERGAQLSASGPGAEVILHSRSRTAHHGSIAAHGAGAIEVSSRGALAVDGAMDAARVLIDPVTLRVVATLSGSTEPAEITAAAINATTGALTLQAEATISVEAAVNKAQGPLTLETTNTSATAAQGIRIGAPLRVAGDLALLSAGDILQDASGATLTAATLFARSTGGQVRLDAGGNAVRALDGGGAATRFDIATTTALDVEGLLRAPVVRLAPNQRLTLRAPIEASDTLLLEALRGVTQAGTGAGISAGTLRLEAQLGNVALTGTGNRIATLGDTLVPAGLTLENEIGLLVAGALTGGQVTLRAASGDLEQDPASSRVTSPDLSLRAPGGSVFFDGPLNRIDAVFGTARDSFVVEAGGPLLLSAPITAGVVDLRATGEIAQDQGATLTAGLLRLNAIGGAITLDDPANRVQALGDVGAGGAFVLATGTGLALGGVVAAPRVSLTAGGGIVQAGGRIETAALDATARAGAVRLDAAGNAVAALRGSGATGDFTLSGAGPLVVEAPLTAGGAVILSAQSIAVAAPVRAGGDLRLSATSGDLTQGAAGTLTAAGLSASAPLGTVRLEAANAVGRIGGAAGFDFRVATAGSPGLDAIAAPLIALRVGGDLVQGVADAPLATDRLEVAAGGRVVLEAANVVPNLGPVSAPGGFTLSTGTALTLNAPIAVPDLRLSALGDIVQLAGAGVTTARLDAVSQTGSVRLDAGDNAIASITRLRAAGEARLATGGALLVQGPIAAGGLVSLQANDTLSQAATGAGITVALLEARSLGGDVALTGAGNAVARLGRGGAAGRYAFAHAGGAPLLLEGLLAAPVVEFTLPQGMAQAAGGAIRAPLLRLEAEGAVRLDAPGHVVEAVGGRAASLILADEGRLAVVEALTVAGLLDLRAEALDIAAPLRAGSAVLVAFGTDGGITQGPGGTFSAGTLSAEAMGAIALEGAGNAIGRVTFAQAEGRVALRSTGALDLGGVISGDTLVLRAGGEMRLDGATLQAARGVLLAVPGGLAAGSRSTVVGREGGRGPALVVDARRAGGLTALPDFVAADIEGRADAAQPTQLAAFGPASGVAGAPAVLDVVGGAVPLFLLLDAGPVLGAVEVGRLAVLGGGGSAFLLGSVGGVSGDAAASRIQLSAGASATTYRFNNCAFGSTTCGAGPTDPTDPTDPVEPRPPSAGLPPRPPLLTLLFAEGDLRGDAAAGPAPAAEAEACAPSAPSAPRSGRAACPPLP